MDQGLLMSWWSWYLVVLLLLHNKDIVYNKLKIIIKFKYYCLISISLKTLN
jgi:hypothetical protein